MYVYVYIVHIYSTLPREDEQQPHSDTRLEPGAEYCVLVARVVVVVLVVGSDNDEEEDKEKEEEEEEEEDVFNRFTELQGSNC